MPYLLIKSLMIAPSLIETQVLVEPQIERKLKQLDSTLNDLLRGERIIIPNHPGRDVQILPIKSLPAKKGLSSKEGQARLLHDLASIELQAMELCVRTLADFPEAPPTFRAELADIARDEGRHLQLCLNGLNDLGFPWGSFPTHLGLWQAVSHTDELLDRLVIVHRYLEGSGLDASSTLMRRLSGVKAPEAMLAVDTIQREELGHVQFGSRWYHRLLIESGLSAEIDFPMRLDKVLSRIPRRREPICRDVRLSAGFLEHEIETLQAIQERFQVLNT